MATIYLVRPLLPPLLRSYANTVHSCGSFTVQGRRRAEWMVRRGKGKKGGGRGERDCRLTVCQQTQLGEKRGCPLTAPSNQGERGREGCGDK